MLSKKTSAVKLSIIQKISYISEYYPCRGLKKILIKHNKVKEIVMLELFELETCPYCRKVMDFMDANHIEYEKRDANNKKNFETLMKIGGHDQVPFLYDEEKNLALYDSDAIITFLKDAFKK